MLDLKTVVDEMNHLCFLRQKEYPGRIETMDSDKKKEVKKMQKRIQYLKVIRQYLESDPTEDFVKKEIDRVENRISLIDAQCFIIDKQTKKEYEKEQGVPQLRTQLRALRFILKK